jgi:hypothetical protein
LTALLAPEALLYLAVGAVLKGDYLEMLLELAERSSAVKFIV